MPLVFVHGVSVRKNKDFFENEKLRDGYFRKFALDQVAATPAKAVIKNPYWGEYGATFAWNHACLPDQNYEQFGSGENVFDDIVAEVAPDVAPASASQLLLSIARQHGLLHSVDCIWAASAFTKPDGEVEPAVAAMAWKAVQYADQN